MPFSVLKNTVSNSGMWKPKIFLSISIYLLGKEKWNCLYLERRFQWRVSVQSWRNTSPRKRRNASGGQCRPTETAAFRQTHPWMTKQMTRWRIRQARTCRSTLVIVTSNGPSGKKAVKRSDQVGKRQSNGPSGKKALELFMNCTQPVVFHSATTLQETRNINVETDYETQWRHGHLECY